MSAVAWNPGRKPVYYHVRPRYTAGSPALVSEQIARHVAAQELEGYNHTLDGTYGVAKRQQALSDGLKGIAYMAYEGKKAWITKCLITNEVYERPFKRALPAAVLRGAVLLRASQGRRRRARSRAAAGGEKTMTAHPLTKAHLNALQTAFLRLPTDDPPARLRYQLDREMSAYSEEQWAASWLVDLEYVLWEKLLTETWHAPGIHDATMALRLWRIGRLALAVDGWFTFEGLPRTVFKPRFVPMAEWLGLYAAYVARPK